MKGPTQVSYAKMGYWRIGGDLQQFYIVETIEDLQSLIQNNEDLTLVGNGSNALMSDQGCTTPCIQLAGDFCVLKSQRKGFDVEVG